MSFKNEDSGDYFFYLYEPECHEIFNFLLKSKIEDTEVCISLSESSEPRFTLSNSLEACQENL